jgi:hypothetical protein
MIQNSASHVAPAVANGDASSPAIGADSELVVEMPLAQANPLQDLAWQTFLSDLPKLLHEHADEFVAYQGNVRIGLDASPWELDLLVAALPPGTAAVFQIQPVSDVDLDGEVGPLL